MSAIVNRQRRTITGILVLTLLPTLITRGDDYGGGSGTPEDPYLIHTPEQMNAIGLHEEDWDRHFMLTADIDLSSYVDEEFNSIARFRGIFDGGSHVISNFTCIAAEQTYVGMFGWLADPQAQIKNLVLINSVVNAEAGDHVGALVGYLGEGTVTNCHVIDGVVLADKAVGGLVGSNMGGVIANCSATGEATGDESIGGLVGMHRGVRIINSCARGNVLGNDNVGGLAGTSYGGIVNCYADCQVSGQYDVGGLVGHHGLVAMCGTLKISMPGRISCCYSVGQVAGQVTTGGLIGANHCGDIDACFWDVLTTEQVHMCGTQGDDNSFGADDGGRLTAQMQTSRTFIEASWDFVGEAENGTGDTWWILEGRDYPRLWWELLPED